MLGQKDRGQPELFVAGSLRALLPDDHILVRVDRVLDLSWLRAEVSDCYSSDKGRPGIDPEAAVRLMLAGFLLSVVRAKRKRIWRSVGSPATLSTKRCPTIRR